MDKSLLGAKLKDAVRLSYKNSRFIGFLDPSEVAQLMELVKYNTQAEFNFWGGFQEAERKLLSVAQPYNSGSGFPIVPLTFNFRDQDELTHRDFLGAFMSKGVERAALGDILVETGRAVIFVKEELMNCFLQNITKIGRTGVKITVGCTEPLPQGHKFLEMSGVVASERLDCILAFALKTSREKAVAAINTGLVAVNYKEADSLSFKLNEGDVLSVRHSGKFIVEKLGPLTKKGRLSLLIRKYV